MRYKNKIDLWVKILLLAVTFMFLPMMFFVPEEEITELLILTAVMVVIIIPLFFGYIELNDDEIIVRLSVFRMKIKYDNVKSIRSCTNFLSSMAMTKDRIEIKTHKKGFLMGTTFIGPENREEVLDILKRRCRNLE